MAKRKKAKKRLTREQALKRISKVEKMLEAAHAEMELVVLDSIVEAVTQKGLRLRRTLLNEARRRLREVRAYKRWRSKQK